MLVLWVVESLLAYAMQLHAINSGASIFWDKRYQSSRAGVLVLLRALTCDWSYVQGYSVLQALVRITQQRSSSLRGLLQCYQLSGVHELGHSALP